MEQQLLMDLIQRSRAGDRQAQEKLVGEAQNRVYYHCKKMLKNDEDALDATQDVLITMLTSLDKLREPAAFWGWVNGITANQCKHLLTQGTKEWQIPEDEEGNSLLDDVEDLDDQVVPDRAMDNAETQRLMAGIIDALPPEQKMSVLFFYYDEMSVKEIAAAMEVSEGTVKSRLNYARKAIKDGVERLAKQGTKLYGISPLPFLAYFLRMGAQSQVLSPATAAALTQGTLVSTGAVGAATGTAVGTAASSTGTATAATAVGAKTVGVVSTKVVAAALAGTLAVGGVGMAAYVATHQEPSPTPFPSPTAVMAVVTPTPMPTLEETLPPEETPEPTPESTATSEPSEIPEGTSEPTLAVEDFAIEDGVLVKYNGPGGDVVVPDGVTVIGEKAFQGNRAVTSVTLPYGVTKIAGSRTPLTGSSYSVNGAFSLCPNLASITIPSSVTEIEMYAFNMAGLASITIPGSVTTIGVWALEGCDKLTELTISEGVHSIGADAFLGCKNLTTVTIPESVSEIGYEAFLGCNSLSSVTILNKDASIGNDAFSSRQPILTIYGKSGSTAEVKYSNPIYASSEIRFVALDTPAPIPEPTEKPGELTLSPGSVQSSSFLYWDGEDLCTDITITNKGNAEVYHIIFPFYKITADVEPRDDTLSVPTIAFIPTAIPLDGLVIPPRSKATYTIRFTPEYILDRDLADRFIASDPTDRISRYEPGMFDVTYDYRETEMPQ